MENAIWGERLLTATDIAKDYQTEKEVRKASSRKELRCPDPECQYPIIRYCHGEIKEAFFAHLNNERCDYADFDITNTQVIRNIKRRFKKYVWHSFTDASAFAITIHLTKILFFRYSRVKFSMRLADNCCVPISTATLFPLDISKSKCV